jgi:flavin reductase (DIM6/NTAB) family NADH-FMN oxidoreductase RutF
MPVLDTRQHPAADVYHVMTALVAPRPIGWISTRDAAGVPNLAPFGCFGICAFAPPVVYFTDNGSTTDTLRNVRATGEFVCNIVSADLVEAANFSAVDFPAGEDEFAWCGLTPVPGHAVGAPRVAQARASLECRLRQIVMVGEDSMVMGDILAITVEPEVLRSGRVDPDALQPVGRYPANTYVLAGDSYRLPRTSWAELVAGRAGRLAPFRPGAWTGPAKTEPGSAA